MQGYFERSSSEFEDERFYFIVSSFFFSSFKVRLTKLGRMRGNAKDLVGEVLGIKIVKNL